MQIHVNDVESEHMDQPYIRQLVENSYSNIQIIALV